MVVKRSIHENLKALDRAYRTAQRPIDALFCSKLAILELCGWIEESMDSIVLTCSKKHLTNPVNAKHCADDIVGRTFGFDYDKNFRRMLIGLIGLIKVEALEKSIDPIKFGAFKGALSTLKQQRDTQAHTHINGITKTINAPSWTLGQLGPIYEGLKEVERGIRKLQF